MNDTFMRRFVRIRDKNKPGLPIYTMTHEEGYQLRHALDKAGHLRAAGELAIEKAIMSAAQDGKIAVEMRYSCFGLAEGEGRQLLDRLYTLLEPHQKRGLLGTVVTYFSENDGVAGIVIWLHLCQWMVLPNGRQSIGRLKFTAIPSAELMSCALH